MHHPKFRVLIVAVGLTRIATARAQSADHPMYTQLAFALNRINALAVIN